MRRMFKLCDVPCGARDDQQSCGRACGERARLRFFGNSPHRGKCDPFAPHLLSSCVATLSNGRTLTPKRKNLRKCPKTTLGERRVASPCGKLHPLPRRSHSPGPHRRHLRPRQGPAVRAAPLRRGRRSSGNRRRGLCGHQARAVCCPGEAQIQRVSACGALLLRVAERKD